MTSEMTIFSGGVLATIAALSGLAFLKFWTVTRDRLFLFFCAAFWLLGLNWATLAVAHPSNETRHLVYLVRLAAFVLILVGIVDKNRRTQRSPRR